MFLDYSSVQSPLRERCSIAVPPDAQDLWGNAVPPRNFMRERVPPRSLSTTALVSIAIANLKAIDFESYKVEINDIFIFIFTSKISGGELSVSGGEIPPRKHA